MNLVSISVVLEILSAFTLPENVPICNAHLSLIHCHATEVLVQQAHSVLMKENYDQSPFIQNFL